MSAAAKQGVKELREASWMHAQRRASALQRAQSSSLGACAENVQGRDYAQRVRRESNDLLRSSRSSGFDQCAQTGRNERLELTEDVERGPYTFEAPLDDATFERFEPHARTKLRKRYIPHASVNAYMNCRYAISPSTLYSLTGRSGSSSEYVRDFSQPAMDGDFEVPLYGDWVLFAVMSEKSALKYTNKTPSDATPTKYFSCKLLDLNTQYTNIYHELPGHCVMNMLAFESSRGTSAFDKLWKERDGVLLAILNPRIMRARKGSNELTISPRSADSVLVLGLAEQYGRCEAHCRDGSRCTAFVLRHPKSQGVCAMHLEKAIAGHQRSRMEFATAAASYVVPPPSKLHPTYSHRPSKRVRPPMDGLHYVVPGLTPSNHDPSSHMYDVSSQLGRGLEQKRQRKRRELEEAGQLSKLHAHGPEPKNRRMLDAQLLADMVRIAVQLKLYVQHRQRCAEKIPKSSKSRMQAQQVYLKVAQRRVCWRDTRHLLLRCHPPSCIAHRFGQMYWSAIIPLLGISSYLNEKSLQLQMMMISLSLQANYGCVPVGTASNASLRSAILRRSTSIEAGSNCSGSYIPVDSTLNRK